MSVIRYIKPHCESLGREVRLVFCDISKAFDRVWHTVYSFGINGKLLAWFQIYLNKCNRKGRVVIKSNSSDLLDIKADVSLYCS